MIYNVEIHYWHSRASFSRYYIVEADNEDNAITQIAVEEGPNPATTRVRISAYPLDLSKPVYLYETN